MEGQEREPRQKSISHYPNLNCFEFLYACNSQPSSKQQETRRDKLEVLSSGDERDWEYQNPAEVE